MEIRVAIQRFRCRKALGLKLLRKTPEGTDLAQSNPALFWLLVNRVRTGTRTLEEASGLIFKRRREIAGACGCEASESTIRVLARIEAISWEEEFVRPLTEVAVDTQVMKSLSALALHTNSTAPADQVPDTPCGGVGGKTSRGATSTGGDASLIAGSPALPKTARTW